MRLSSRGLWLSLAFGVLSFVPARAVAQEDDAATSQVAVTPPKLVKFVSAEFNEGEAPTEPTSVLLELIIDEQGHVAEAKVIESAGERIDGAVVEAANQFEFEPAKRGDVPLRVKVRYEYAVPAAPASNPVPTTPASKPAPTTATPESPDSKPESSVAPKKSADLEEYVGVAEVEAPPREVTRRSIEQEQLTRIPGTRGDALRAIEVMPGVARTSVDNGAPILRGAAWNESSAFLDGISIPFLYHFGGLTSFMNSRLIERVDLYPSNFSTRYGRLAGGVIDVRVRDPRSDGFHGVLDLNLIDSSLLLETPITDTTAVAVAARRSNIDFFFENFVPDDAYSVVAAPVYWDYQAIVTQKLGTHTRLRVLGFGSRDSLQLLFSNPNDEDPGLSGQIGATTEFHRVQVELRSELDHTATQELTLSVGRTDADQHFGEVFQRFGGQDVRGRAEWSFELSPALRLTTGGDFTSWFYSGEYHGPQAGGLEGDPADHDPLASRRLLSLTLDDWSGFHSGGYADLGIRPFAPLLVTPGVRADYYSDLKSWSVDPRIAARLEVTSSTTLKAGVGRYTQAPEIWQPLPGIGNPNIDPYYAIQTSAGIEQTFGRELKLGVEGFYKWLDQRIVPTQGSAPPHYVNDGQGRILGAEFSAEFTPRKGTFAYLAYTLSRSERRDDGGDWRLFDQDQTHILTVAASHDLGKGWELGGRFRLVSGNPTTPIVGSTYDARTGVYVPEFGAVNSEREPFFHQLDLRIEKGFHIGKGKLAVYLDLQNVYNAKNVEGTSYSFDYRKKQEATGLPFFPNFGLRGEL